MKIVTFFSGSIFLSKVLIAQIGVIGVEVNYGFQNLNKRLYNKFFESFDTVFIPETPTRRLSSVESRGFGVRATAGAAGGNKNLGFFFLMNYEFNHGGWKRVAEFPERITQVFQYKCDNHKFVFEVGADLHFIFLSGVVGLQLNRARLNVYNELPTGNHGMSSENKLNGFYNSSALTFPLGFRTGMVIKRMIRIPLTVEYNWPLKPGAIFLEDKLFPLNNNQPPAYKRFPADASGNGSFTHSALQGWTIRFGIQFTFLDF